MLAAADFRVILAIGNHQIIRDSPSSLFVGFIRTLVSQVFLPPTSHQVEIPYRNIRFQVDNP
jgi:hypothetical protein